MLKNIFSKPEAVECSICGGTSELVSKAIGFCVDCLREKPHTALRKAKIAHKTSRKKFDLPPHPPRNEQGVKCGICSNACEISEDERGFCGLRTNKDGKIIHLAGTPSKGILEWYYDPLPTNCVADWICPGGTGCGYPKYSYRDSEPEYGYNNLAVFYGACTFDCLFCQNWHYRSLTQKGKPAMTSEELASKVSSITSCICYFGGDPTAQLPHAISASKIALAANKDRILRICWESNGTMMPSYLKTMAELSLKSGGCIKIDLKAWNEHINQALCGASNGQTLQNIEFLARFGQKRREPPFLVVSTLLVPGYVDIVEVEKIAEFLASLDPEIPYSLLAFHPDFEMADMPVTSPKVATECVNVAKNAGLKSVRIGNVHLLV